MRGFGLGGDGGNRQLRARLVCGAWLAVLVSAAPALAQAPERRRPVEFESAIREGRPHGRYATVRVDRRSLRRRTDREGRVRLRLPLGAREGVELDVEPFEVTSGATHFVRGRKTTSDQTIAYDSKRTLLLRGEVAGRPGSRVFLALRDGGHTGFIDLGPGAKRYRLASRDERGLRLEPDRALVYETQGAPELPPEVPFCGVEGEALSSLQPIVEAEPDELVASLGAAAPVPRPGIQHLQLAIETDYEFFQLFGDETAALDYVVALYGEVSAIYLRDVDTHVELSFVRIWDQPDDLFNDVDPSPLSDFRNYWNANMGGVTRDVAQLISGRRDYPFGGQAYLSSLCGSNAYGVVGYAQGEFADPSMPGTLTYDIAVTAHELGHNAGTGHTHDSPNNIDECDDPLSTPQRGSIMSYCGQTWSGGNANRDLYFHSVIQSNMDSHIGAVSCVVDDCDLNGIADSVDIAGGAPDANSNGIPDSCEDCDGNGTLDPADIAGGAADIDLDGIPDVCEPDCNGNGVPDDFDISTGASTDAYGDDVPDECEADCDSSGGSDYTQIQLDMTLDIDRNRTLDSCQDCDSDTTPDAAVLDGAHGIWLGSGLASAPMKRFHAVTGVTDATSSGSGTIAEAQDVLVTADGRVLVSSAMDDRVLEFDRAGNYVGDLVGLASGGTLSHPHGLAISPAGELLVASGSTNEVLAYDLTTGAFQSAFVSAGSGGLVSPFGLAIGPNGNLFVSTGDDQVLEYDGTTGTSLGAFVPSGSNGGLSEPKAILFKPDGNLLVTSYGTDQTLEYHRDTGFPLGPWARSGTATRLTQVSPWGLRVGPNGNVYIVRTGEAFGSGASGAHHHHDHEHLTAVAEAVAAGELHLTNAQIYEFDVQTGGFLRSYVNGNDHGHEFPTGFDFVPGWDVDCNQNQLPDSCDIAQGTSLDVDTSGVPDECEIDCNSNGTLDRLDIIPFGSSFDCNANLVPDECDSIAGTPGACEVAVETSCTDGFDNDRDGLADCADSDCDATAACPGAVVWSTGFDASAAPFGYVDDAFRGTSQPSYASGAYGGTGGFEGTGGLTVQLAGIDNADIIGMSGGWQRSFSLTEPLDLVLTVRFKMDQSPDYESDEFSQVMASLDGTALLVDGNDYLVQLTGDGTGGEVRTSGWMRVEIPLGVVSAGAHDVVIGGYNNKKTQVQEFVDISIDDVAIRTVTPIVCGDGNVGLGEECDDGGTSDGDCCSALCQFEAPGSACDDADACTVTDTCDGAGGCVPGAPLVCDDGVFCNGFETCSSAVGCEPGTPPQEDGVDCTVDTCDELAMTVMNDPDPLLCDDGDVCTAESCDAIAGCMNTPIPGCVPPAVPIAAPPVWILWLSAIGLAPILFREKRR